MGAPIILTSGQRTPVIVTAGSTPALIVTNPARGAVLSAPYLPIIKVEQGDDVPVGYVGLVVREQ